MFLYIVAVAELFHVPLRREGKYKNIEQTFFNEQCKLAVCINVVAVMYNIYLILSPPGRTPYAFHFPSSLFLSLLLFYFSTQIHSLRQRALCKNNKLQETFCLKQLIYSAKKCSTKVTTSPMVLSHFLL